MPQSDINSWEDLTALIPEYRDGWIFRGEDCSKNKLQPKIGRLGNEKNSPRKVAYDSADEINLLKHFKQQARPYLHYEPNTDIEWLAIAQHHGMPTRLLDWTESLFVATYFATLKAGTEGDAVIYALHLSNFTDETDEKNPFVVKTNKIYRPPHITPRIPAQQSIFLLTHRPCRPFIDNNLHRWIIQSDQCFSIKKNLDACAINERSLFPGLDGLSQYLGWRYKWGRVPKIGA